MNLSKTPSKVLVVDDNADNRALAKAALEDEGYEVLIATTGADALAAVAAESPDCVLLDVRMPGMDGFAVCSRIRAMPEGANLPVVFLTALRDVDTFDQALRAGGDDFLTKPVRPAELAIRVQVALRLRRMSSDLREHHELVRRQRDDLMRLQLQKEQLTAFLVHDLKNPINSMDLHAQLLLRHRDLSTRARESVEHIRSESRSLLRLVLNLLDISRAEEGGLAPQFEDVDLQQLVQEVMEAFEIKARAASVSLTATIEAPSLVADPDLLRRVLENLLDNAVRHAPESTQIRLTAQSHPSGIEVRVADEGDGVAPEFREQVFERFVQIESAGRQLTRTGRGLGLAFCKLVVETHGGRIWIEDAAPGAIFCFRLPHDPRTREA